MISDFPLFLFTSLTGLAAGAALADALIRRRDAAARPWLLPAAIAVVVVLGSLASVAHLGRPDRMIHMVNNPTSSLVLEGIFAGLFALAALTEAIVSRATSEGTPQRALRVVVAVLGIALLVVQAYAYASSFGDPAWSAPSVWAFFILGSTGCGFGLAAFALRPDRRFLGIGAAAAALACLSFAWEGASFSQAGESPALLYAGSALAAAAAALSAVAMGQRPERLRAFGAVCALIGVAALAVARYGFYLASII